uniref:tumor necrosis factor receptor superfamily member 5 n=1 Tax=Euleptes europaea TaxID=460621 RepID=UPI0025402B71|nr:tumor necrosis factor receptor superfamily member 5 [Euleptes europaea]
MTAGWLEAWAGGALLALTCLALDTEQNCDRTQYEAHGKCCSRCPPGQRVQTLCDASEGSDTACQPCQPGHFQGSWTKQMACTPHRYCDQNAGLVVHIQGSATHNAMCRCRNGSHCSSTECQSCRENSACGPGKGVKQIATDTNDTLCIECPRGFFSNVSSAVAPCQPWSSCGATGLVLKANGTRFSDVTCGEAQRAHSPALGLAALAAVVLVLGGMGLLLWRRRLRRKELLKLQKNRPTEVDEEDNPALPIQETRPTIPGVGKDNCVAEQECA